MNLKTIQLNYHIVLIVFVITAGMTVNSQNLEKHQWMNRVILIISNDSTSEIYNSQIKEFSNNTKEFADRKLLVYHIFPNTYKILNDDNDSWIKGSALFKKYSTQNRDFKIILIGLDGNIKLEQYKLLTTEQLFTTIDAMPMRRAEIKNKP